MGQQGSKSSIEARVIFQRVGSVDLCQKTDACFTPAFVVHIQKKVTSQSACLHSSSRALEKSTPHNRPQSRCDTGGLVYVMDNPTGGVWVKPGEKRTSSWYKNKISRRIAHELFDGIKSSTLWLKLWRLLSSRMLPMWVPALKCIHTAASGIKVDLNCLSDIEELAGLITNLLI